VTPVRRSWLPWGLLAVALVVVVLVGGLRSGGPSSNAERVDALAKQVRCPACRSQSVFDSDTPSSRAIKEEVARRVEVGQTDAEILGYVESRFGSEILLSPTADGINALVWGLPVAVLVLGAGGLVLAFRRWQANEATIVTDADRRLVAAALRAEDDDVGEGAGR